MNTLTLMRAQDILAEQGILVRCERFDEACAHTILTGIACDSRAVRPGNLFVCKGAAFKADYLVSAIKAGAVAYLCDEAPAPALEAATEVPALITSNVRRAMALLAPGAFGHPEQALRVVGVTGTKGKSTVTSLLAAALDAAAGEKSTALIGSIKTDDGVECFESHNTTPESPDLWRHLANARDAGLRFVDLEVSSQGLKYDRVYGVPFEVGVFLNIGEDHISPAEHSSFEDYFAAKLKIFEQSRVAVVNLDADYAATILEHAAACERVIRISPQGTEGADIWASDVLSHRGRLSFIAHSATWEVPVRLAMPGLFNVDNALATLAVCEALGLSPQKAAPALAQVRVAGRMELYHTTSPNLLGLIDYAHNQLSFNKLFASLARELPGWRIIALFGAAGDKAFERRKTLPEAAAQWSDYLVYTNEDPGHEPPEDICNAMAANTPAGIAHTVIVDRDAAVAHAVDIALSEDQPAIVCLLAKGDETYMHIGDAFVPCKTDLERFTDALQSHGLELAD